MFATTLALCGAPAGAQDAVTVVDHPDPEAKANAFYHDNREPLLPSPLIKLPIGSVEPRGWLRQQLQLQADGFLGHLTEISAYCSKEDNAWLSADGQGRHGWEEVPYWFRGFCALGYVLNDERIIDESKPWLEAILASQREDGYFGPRSNLREDGVHDLMPNMFIAYALRSYHEVTGDPRVLELLTNYFQWQLAIPDDKFFAGGWQVPRTADNMDSIIWLYNRTGDAFLMDLLDKTRRAGATWMRAPTGDHNVNYSQGFRKPAHAYLLNRDEKYLEQAYENYDVMHGIYGQVPGGMFAGDEFARPGFTDPRNAIETCGVTEMMLSQQILLRITGDLTWADRHENIAFNTLPAVMTADMKGVRYLTSVNQISSDRRNRGPEIANSGDMFSMNPHSHRCCQHNASMGWPYYADNLWHATPGNGLAATSYSASKVRAKVGDGTEVTIVQDTRYPFDGEIELALESDQPVRFPLYLRIPDWCSDPQVSLNGRPLAVEGRPRSFLRIEREWAQGDRLTLALPMEAVVRRWEKQRNAASVDRGPLSFSVKIGEEYTTFGGTDRWPAREIQPTTPWNYGLVLGDDPAASLEVVMKPWPESNMVFTHEGAPVELRAQAKRIPNWTDTGMGLPGRLQPSPIVSDEPVETITLIPMGAGRLRLASFPVIGTGPDARAWEPTPPMPASYWPNPRSPGYLRNGRLPTEGTRTDCFKWVGWAGHATGQLHWVRQDFDREATVSSCEIFWAPEGGWLTSPEWWKLHYRDGDEWKEVELVGEYEYHPGIFTRVRFEPVKTRALKIEAQTRDSKSSGIYEWRSWLHDGDLRKHSVMQDFGVDIMGDPVVREVSSCEVFWHVDPGNPNSRPPTAWKLFTRQDGEWKEVANAGEYGLDPVEVNTVTFDPVETTAMRLDVYAEPGASSGPREWRIR